MLLGLRKGLKSIDFYQAVPNQLSEGTISGACISIVTVTLLITLLTITILDFRRQRLGSDMIIDHKHLQQKLRVNIDISFPNYPCSILSLDVQNILKVHQVNIGGPNLKKINLPQGTPYEELPDFSKRLEKLIQDFAGNKGCRMKGWFEIDRVPGNFHFSCHGYSDLFQALLNSGLAFSQKKIDMSHQIHQFWFGQNRQMDSETLLNFHSRKQIGQMFLGISYTYFLDIVENNIFDTVRNTSSEHYYYTVRMNEIIIGSAPMVYFRYQTNPITVLTFAQYSQWHQLFVKIVGLVGGIFTVSIILDSMVHSSILFLLEKHRLNKLR